MGTLNSKIDGSKDEAGQNSNAGQPESGETAQNVKTSYKFDEIVKKADKYTSDLDLKEQAHTGIFLDQKKKKFWVDENGNNCFMIFARDLSIIWGEDQRYFGWIPEKESDTQVEVAVLKKVCWLEIDARFDVSLLTPNITYQVLFNIKMKKSSFGWFEEPVNLQLRLPTGEVKRNRQKLDITPQERWINIKVGEFETRRGGGEMVITLIQLQSTWKGGLIIKGVMICPK
ncbi:hypothetical protein LUZ60_007163 [Juncus effusus]|nr:hypothetical protein LUZ60_007163 [Juncus effusus]